jgi:hypothetical protein
VKNFSQIRSATKAAMMSVASLVLVIGLVAQEGAAGGKVVTERTDPVTGARWLLVRDAKNAAGPARWVLATAGRQMSAGSRVDHGASTQTPVIHAGDRIVLEERTAVLEARFEATALTGAESNEPLRARLTIGGKVLSARAVAPGLAAIEEETR